VKNADGCVVGGQILSADKTNKKGQEGVCANFNGELNSTGGSNSKSSPPPFGLEL
jgi:hypothetical protein